jgi:glycosyltransferase involved in cell wall biosynthesis
MKFSLIVATLGREAEIERLFRSLAEQTHRNFEVIVVDQNPDDRVGKIVQRYRELLDIVYLRSKKGLSRARNVGLRAVRGDVVGFPDDDCWYPPQTLESVAARLAAESHLVGVTGRCIDPNGAPSHGRWAKSAHLLNRYNIWISATSPTIFVRSGAIYAVAGFDEQLGVGSGSRWGSGEEVHFLLGVLRAGYPVRYEPSLRIYHCEPITSYDDRAYLRGRLYNRGFGRVLSVNHYPLFFVFYSAARPAIGCALSVLKGDIARARYYWIAATQRILGWMD